MTHSPFKITSLPENRWKECRNLRLEALQVEPPAFASSYEEEVLLSEQDWRARIHNAYFALEQDMPVGMIVLIRNKRPEKSHIVNVFGFYVKLSHRGKGIGTQLFEHATSSLRKQEGILRIELAVTLEQKAAISLYKKQGFETVGISRKKTNAQGTWFDELIMEKLL